MVAVVEEDGGADAAGVELEVIVTLLCLVGAGISKFHWRCSSDSSSPGNISTSPASQYDACHIDDILTLI